MDTCNDGSRLEKLGNVVENIIGGFDGEWWAHSIPSHSALTDPWILDSGNDNCGYTKNAWIKIQ